MILIEGTSAHAWGNGQWVIHCPNGRNFLINERTHSLYQILTSHSSYLEALDTFNLQFQTTYSEPQFRDMVGKVLGGYQILAEDIAIARPKVLNNYLKLKVQLVNARVAGFLAQPLTYLYSPTLFWKLFVGLISFLSYWFYAEPMALVIDPKTISPESLALLPFLFYASMPVHELGHIAACRNSGLQHGGIGFGFYFLLPVMYADITQIWLANKERRTIANLGGIFSELLYASLLVLTFTITQDPIYYVAGLSIALFVVWEFNPFVRFDGYWILADLTGTPNLLQKSKQMVQRVGRAWWKQEEINWNTRMLGLFVYGILNTALLFLFMGYMAWAYQVEVVQFPEKLVWTLENWLHGNWDFSEIHRTFFVVLTFYILILRLLIQYGTKIFRAWRKGARQGEADN